MKRLSWLFEIILVCLILTGVFFRFNWTNWSEGTNLHPDEYGLTNTLTFLSIPTSIDSYFNTRLSPLSPYAKYDINGVLTSNGPDNRMRWGQWPITLLRFFGELTKNTGYNEIRLMGRTLSAAADTLSLLMIFLIGSRLYNRKVGLVAAALSSLAVMQIQQSHFMTSDNFALLFTSLTMYAAVRIAQSPGLVRRVDGREDYQPVASTILWYLLFGVTFGMTLASRINLAPLAGMVLIAALISIADMKLRTQRDLRRIILFTSLFLVLSGVAALLTFRVTQPMTFRAAQGDTSFFTVNLNNDWVESMKVAQSESSGIGGGPPGEQWTHRPALFFPWINMVLWGMGLPLGLAAWIGLLWAAWRILRKGENWHAHLLPLVWVGGYFLFMGTRWVKSVRYFLPIYPFLCLFAAWILLDIWQRWQGRKLRVVAGIAMVGVLLGTLAWASSFVDAVYINGHTRIQAAAWIYQNIPGSFQITLQSSTGPVNQPISAPDSLRILPGTLVSQPFDASTDGTLGSVKIPRASASNSANSPNQLRVWVARDPQGQDRLAETVVNVTAPANAPAEITATFKPAALKKGERYYLLAQTVDMGSVVISHLVVSNESWDEGLPMPMNGYDPFGGLYRGIEMEVRWPDDTNKRKMFVDNLAQVDYIILPSQRAIWSACRIPLTYPMTMEYYRALFDGRLGFDLVAQFQDPFVLGPLEISDVGGTIAWNQAPKLPLFNYSQIAAEEAFSVYDHPPVWIFKKRADFNMDNARKILEAIDLSKVVIQGPLDATWPANLQ
jgi:hypothetical protein